jgi:hypothetical protein
MTKKSRQLVLQKLVKEIIQEVGDLRNVEPYKFNYVKTLHAGAFTIPEIGGVTMYIEDITHDILLGELPPVFSPYANEIFQIGYTVEGVGTQYKKTDYKQLIKILKTVLEFTKRAVPDVLEKYGQGTIFGIASQAKDTEDFIPSPQKDALYRAIVLQNLPEGFRNVELNLNGKPTILFQKIKTRK